MKKFSARIKLATRAQRADRTPSSAPGVADEDDAASDDSEVVEGNDIADDHDSQMEENPFNEDDDDNNDDDNEEGEEGEGRDEDEEEKDDGDGNSDQADNEDEEPTKEVERGIFGLDATERAIELMQIGVKEIILTDRTIGDEGAVALGKELGKNTSLLTLGLANNEICEEGCEALAEALRQNSTLTSLSLESNNLGKAGLTALAEALNVNTTLKTLSLGGSIFRRDPSGDEYALALEKTLAPDAKLATLNLQASDVSVVGCQSIADLLCKSKFLKEIVLRNNKIGDEGAIVLGEALGKMTSLTSLDLRSNEIGALGAAGLGDGLGANKSLSLLDLEFNPISDEGAVGIGKSLSRNGSLKEMNLRGCQIGSVGAAGLAEGLGKNTSLKDLDLAVNKVGAAGAQALGQALSENTSLASLSLERNTIDALGAVGLGEGLSQSKSLASLDLSRNQIGDEGAVGLGKALGKNTSLKELNLQTNAIANKGAIAIGEGVSESNSLCSLGLSMNQIGAAGAAALGKALAKSKTLSTLTLESNDIGDDGAVGLGRGLAQNNSLTILNLYGNEIGDEGAIELGKGLAKNSSLTNLYLFVNAIGDLGAAGLGEGLGKNKSLISLELASNLIGADGAAALADGLAKNKSLISLSLSNNKLGTEGAVELGKKLARNTSLQVLMIQSNEIGDEGAIALGRGVAKHSSLLQFFFACNKISPPGIAAVAELLLLHKKSLAIVGGLPDLPRDLSWDELFSLQRGDVRVQRIRHSLFDAETGQWTQLAHTLARTDAHIFAAFVLVLDKEDPEMHALFADYELWLQVGVSDAYEGTTFADKENELPLIHALLDCHQTTTQFSLQQRFCENIIAKRLLLRDGLLMMEAEDSGGRSVRSLALTNQNTKEWAKTYGTYLDRYSVAEGPPVHESKTCAVHYATDIQTNKAVALKIMRDKEQYAREVSARDISSEGRASLAGCLPLLHREDPDFAARLDAERCLVMPQGSRSLFEAINTERFAGRDLQKVRTIAYKIALAIQDLHNSGRIHGDIKPRNAVRVVPSKQHTFSYDDTGGRVQVPDAWRQNVTGEQLNGPPDEEWQLIDLDASARILSTERVTEKVSTGYAAPELAQWHFLHQANADKAPTVSAALDVWGFGVVLYQMLSGTKLFMVDESDDNLVHGRDKTELMNWLALDHERLERIKERETNGMGKGDGLRSDGADAIEAARDLVRLCLRGDPTERINMTQIIEDHPFFDSMRPQNSCRPGNDEDVATTGIGRDEHRKKKMRFSRRVLSLHKLVVPKRFSLFGRTTSPRLSRDDHTGEFYADHGHNELTELSTYHFFLSHMQKQAAGIVKNLAFGLERYQMSAWTEMRAAEVTLTSLQRGVLSSQRFVLVLTRDTLFRPFCLAGLKFAIDYFSSMPGGLREHIIFIVEEDQRFSPWHTGIDEPWCAVDWEEGNVDLDDEIASAGEFLRSCQTQYNSEQTSSRRKQLDEATAKARSLRRTRDMRQLRESLENLNFDPDEVFGLAEDALSLCKRIPYRRRLFEEDAMLRALADHAGFQVSPPLRPLLNIEADSLFITVVAKSDSEIAIELVAKLNMNATASVLASLFQDAIHEGSSVVIVVLEQDCLDDVHDALTSERLSGLPLLAVADESTFNAGDAEHVSTCSQEVQSRLFDHLELLAWRPDAEVRDGVYMVGHEQPALIDELCSRAAKLRRSQL